MLTKECEKVANLPDPKVEVYFVEHPLQVQLCCAGGLQAGEQLGGHALHLLLVEGLPGREERDLFQLQAQLLWDRLFQPSNWSQCTFLILKNKSISFFILVTSW